MKTNRILIMLFIALVICASSVAAENRAADFLVQTGINEMEKGNKMGAVHEFSKALLLEPENQEAHRYLIQLGHPGGIYPRIEKSQDQYLALNPPYGATKTYEEETRELREEHARRIFRMERAKYENDKDRASYLRDYPELGREEGRYVRDDRDTMSRVSYQSQDRDSRRRSDPIPVPYSREAANKRDVMIQKYLDAHEPDQIRFPNRTFQDPGPASGTVESQRDFYDLQGMIDFSRENETAFYYWLDDEPKSSYELQFNHQDKLIRVLDEYLQVREAQIQAQEDSLLGTELALLRTEKDLAQQVEANNDLHEVYHQVVRYGDDQAYYIAQENDYMQFLEGKLTATRTALSQQSEKVEAQEDLVTDLQAEIAAYRQRVDELLDERQDLLNDVTDRVTELQRIGDVMVRPGADKGE